MDGNLLQKRMRQGAFANSLYPRTVNTVRIVTIRDEKATDGRHKVVRAMQRIGCDKSFPCDNFRGDGLVFEVDLDSGTYGRGTSCRYINQDGTRKFVEKHPDTGLQITGMVIPEWEKVKQQVIDLTAKFPFWEFVAWDVVLKDNGEVALMEMNLASGLTIYQIFGSLRETEIGRFIEKVKNM